jgi:histidine triad (HIT) family protein
MSGNLSRAMKRLYRVPYVAFVLTRGDPPHVYAHVLPMHEKTDITSRQYIVEERLTLRSTARASNDELASSAAALRAVLEQA